MEECVQARSDEAGQMYPVWLGRVTRQMSAATEGGFRQVAHRTVMSGSRLLQRSF
jgi:hypothetical protein